MGLAERYDVTVVDADTGTANLLFHAGLKDLPVTLQDLLVEDRSTPVSDAVYQRFGDKYRPLRNGVSKPSRLRTRPASGG